MADTYTAYLNLTQPEIGASRDAWGQKLNENLTKVDVWAKGANDKITANTAAIAQLRTDAFMKAGGYLSGPIQVEGAANVYGALVSGQGSARTSGYIGLQTGGAGNSGFAEFYMPNGGGRVGYMGYASGGFIQLASEQGYRYKFNARPQFIDATPWDTANFDPNTKASLNATVAFRDIQATRGDGTGVLYFAGRADRYVYWDGANYVMPGAPLVVNSHAVWTAGTFNPDTKANAYSQNFNGGIGAPYLNLIAGGGQGAIYNDSGYHNVVLRHGPLSNPRYSIFNDTSITLGALTAVAGELHVNGGTNSWVRLQDTDEGTRSLHNNGGNIGFVGSDGGWKMYVRDDGSLWTAQLGDINSRIENRGSAYRDSAVSTIRAAYNVFTDNQRVDKAYPEWGLHYPGVRHQAWQLRENGWVYLWDYNAGTWNVAFTTDGHIHARAFGSVHDRIENRGAAYRDAAINSANQNTANSYYPRWINDRVETNSCMVVSRADPFIELLWGGIYRWQMICRSNAEFQIKNGDNSDVAMALRTDGSVWFRQIGDLNSRIEQRAADWAATRQAAIWTGNDGTNRRVVINGVAILMGTAVITSDGNGFGYIAFPWGFADTPTSIVMTNGDSNSGGDLYFSTSNRYWYGFNMRVHYPGGTGAAGITCRVNYIAVGPG